MSPDDRVEDVLRPLVPQVLGALVRRYGHFDSCEDAVQDALLAAEVQWPRDGRPLDPKAWLITVASRRLTDRLRGDGSRRDREVGVATQQSSDVWFSPAADTDLAGGRDDTLTLLFLCCHPTLTPSSQLALTLRAVGGLTTAEIAAAFLVPETTMAQRISRAKMAIRIADAPFALPDEDALPARLAVVLHVLYLVFNEGYSASSGAALVRGELTGEAIRLTRQVHRARPGDGEVAGLLALMLLTEARRPARCGPAGELVLLSDQDRSLWVRELIEEGTALISGALSSSSLGPYQLQAAIAAVHDEAVDDQHTDWEQIVALYELLERFDENPVVTLNRAVAVGKVHGPAAGLSVLDELVDDPRMAANHRVDAVRGHLLEQLGDPAGASAAYASAARRTTSTPEQRHLTERSRRLAEQ